MRRPSDGTAEIVIPTGRNGFCCIVPCALMLALDAGVLVAGLLLARHLVRRAARAADVGRRGGAADGRDDRDPR